MGMLDLEIAKAEGRISQRLPAALAEWIELVSRRLRSVQDSPRLLAQLAVVDSKVPSWIENQGVWTMCTAPNDALRTSCLALSRALGSLASPSISSLICVFHHCLDRRRRAAFAPHLC